MPRRRTLEHQAERRRSKSAHSRETSEQRNTRLANCRERMRRRRASTSEENSEPLQEHSLKRLCQKQSRRRITSTSTYKAARLFKHDHEVLTNNIGQLNNFCMHCRVELFASEMTSGTSSLCCHQDKINMISTIKIEPEFLLSSEDEIVIKTEPVESEETSPSVELEHAIKIVSVESIKPD